LTLPVLFKKPLSLEQAKKNQNGQVALFVALIFQIIFVLFALVINVGLIVHHKINLQQSTDLAAYYGAMKQAEILNVIGHINFQMRQAWKLMTWRYRIIGSFAYQAGDSSIPGIPIGRTGVNSTLLFNEANAKAKCASALGPVGHHDITPFCVGHIGFGDWSGSPTSSENTCDTTCGKVGGAASTISTIPSLTQVSSVPGASVAGSIQALITTANSLGRRLCKAGTMASLAQVSNILAGYFIDLDNKQQSIQLLMSDLIVPADQMIDLDGALVKDGVLKTLENNLTEANQKSLGTSYKFFNSTSTDNSSVGGCADRKAMFHELKFQIVDFIMNVCINPGDGTGPMRENTFESIYKPNTLDINPKYEIVAPSVPGFNLNDVRQILQNEYKIGYEKNPWCQSYFGVRAATNPHIPFLPLTKIQLNATSFAKPFGGSIGPWFYDKWANGATQSDSAKQTDKAMPPLRINPGYGATLAEKLRMLPNFSNYVGDVDGTRDPIYQAIFHDFLLTRSLNRDSAIASRTHVPANPVANTFSKPISGYPYYSNWRNITKQVNESDYDPIAMDQATVGNSYIRDLELAAIAPNQFDLTYYSIDADFYNNYYKNRLDNNGPNRTVDKLKALTGGFNNAVFKPDYGYNKQLSNGSLPEDFSVRHQLAIVEQIFKVDGSLSGRSQMTVQNLNSNSSILDKYFTFIPRFQGSLLTGWTYKDLVSQDGFTEFPRPATGTKMVFGECSDFPATSTPDFRNLIELPVSGTKLPPAPGNCITGGRTGYSVKIVNPAALNGIQGDIGGPGTGGSIIKNAIPEEFFTNPL
jgi:hypothetical protein